MISKDGGNGKQARAIRVDYACRCGAKGQVDIALNGQAAFNVPSLRCAHCLGFPPMQQMTPVECEPQLIHKPVLIPPVDLRKKLS